MAKESLPFCANSPKHRRVLNNRGVAKKPLFESWHRKCKITSLWLPLERAGQTYYFVDEDTRREYEKALAAK